MNTCPHSKLVPRLIPTLAAIGLLASSACTGDKSATTPPGDGSATVVRTIADLLYVSLTYPATMDASVPPTQVTVRPSGDATCSKRDYTGAEWRGELAARDTAIPDLLSRPGVLADLVTWCDAGVSDAGPYIVSRFANDDTAHGRLVAFSCANANLDALEQALERIGDACIAGARAVELDAGAGGEDGKRDDASDYPADAGMDAAEAAPLCLGKPLGSNPVGYPKCLPPSEMVLCTTCAGRNHPSCPTVCVSGYCWECGALDWSLSVIDCPRDCAVVDAD